VLANLNKLNKNIGIAENNNKINKTDTGITIISNLLFERCNTLLKRKNEYKSDNNNNTFILDKKEAIDCEQS